MTSLLADLKAQPDFRTELWSQPEAEPKSEVTQCAKFESLFTTFEVIGLVK